MTDPECIRPQRRIYGSLLSLSIDECGHDWMFATFLNNGEIRTWECVDVELFSLLVRHLAAAAKARLVGARDRELTIWRNEQGGWQIESA